MRLFENRLVIPITFTRLFFSLIFLHVQLANSEYFNESENTMLLREISGTHLLLTAFSDPPGFKILEDNDSNGTIVCTGMSPNIADYLARALNITYSFVRVPFNEVNVYGPKEASINMLMKKEVDVVTRLIALNLDHCTRMDCSLPLYNERIVLMVPWPEEESRILAPIRPFNYKVWIMLILSTIAVSFTLTKLQKFYSNDQSSRSICDGPTVVNFINTGKFNWSPWGGKLSFRIVQGSWCLAALVLFNAYSTTLISYLVAPKLMPVVRTFADLVSGNHPQNLKLLAEKNELLAVLSLNAKSGIYKELGDMLRRNPESLFIDRQKGFDLVYNGRYAYSQAHSRVSVFMDWAYKKAGRRCRLTISNWHHGREFSVVWTFMKNWRHTEIINRKLRYFAESGLGYLWLKEVTPQVSQCYLENYKSGSFKRPKILTLTDLTGPFTLLIAGCALSFFVFLVENIFSLQFFEDLKIIFILMSRIY